jgi:hypothetical protein
MVKILEIFWKKDWKKDWKNLKKIYSGLVGFLFDLYAPIDWLERLARSLDK